MRLCLRKSFGAKFSVNGNIVLGTSWLANGEAGTQYKVGAEQGSWKGRARSDGRFRGTKTCPAQCSTWITCGW